MQSSLFQNCIYVILQASNVMIWRTNEKTYLQNLQNYAPDLIKQSMSYCCDISVKLGVSVSCCFEMKLLGILL